MTPEIVRCIDCRHFSLRTAGQMARQGYGHCEFDRSKAVFQSAVFERHCSKFEAAGAETAQARQDWLDRERERFLRSIGA